MLTKNIHAWQKHTIMHVLLDKLVTILKICYIPKDVFQDCVAIQYIVGQLYVTTAIQYFFHIKFVMVYHIFQENFYILDSFSSLMPYKTTIPLKNSLE